MEEGQSRCFALFVVFFTNWPDVWRHPKTGSKTFVIGTYKIEKSVTHKTAVKDLMPIIFVCSTRGLPWFSLLYGKNRNRETQGDTKPYYRCSSLFGRYRLAFHSHRKYQGSDFPKTYFLKLIKVLLLISEVIILLYLCNIYTVMQGSDLYNSADYLAEWLKMYYNIFLQ